MNPTVHLVGEVMDDVYYFGQASRLSPEGPYPVVKIDKVTACLGGAGNVKRILENLGINVRFQWQEGVIPTKNRLIANGQTIARWDEADEIEPELGSAFMASQVRALIISDYGKGLFTPAIIASLPAGLPTFIDTKQSPYAFERFPDRTFFPNQHEFDAHAAAYLSQPRVICTRGPAGITLFEKGTTLLDVAGQPVSRPLVCGAGDAVIAAYVAAWAEGEGTAGATRYANAAGAAMCRRVSPLDSISREDIHV